MPTVTVYLRKDVYERLRRLAESRHVGWHRLLNQLLAEALSREYEKASQRTRGHA